MEVFWKATAMDTAALATAGAGIVVAASAASTAASTAAVVAGVALAVIGGWAFVGITACAIFSDDFDRDVVKYTIASIGGGLRLALEVIIQKILPAIGEAIGDTLYKKITGNQMNRVAFS